MFDSNILLKSFTASEKGCKIPAIPTLDGPTRNCANLRILRSNKVIKATLIKIGTIKIRPCNNFVIHVKSDILTISTSVF